MQLNYDFHTHTVYSHGKGTILQNAISAKEKGLKGITISDHGFSHPAFGMRRKKIEQMKKDCLQAEEQTGIQVKLGIESNILGISGKIDVKEKDYEKLDMILAGAHIFILYDGIKEWFNFFGRNFFARTFKKKPSDKLIKRNTQVYINAIKNNPIDILTHVSYLFPADAVEVAKVCADYGTYMEINTKKIHLSDEEWQKVLDTKVNFVIDSDAHTPDRVGDTLLADELLNRVNIPLDRIKNIGDNTLKFRFQEFKEKL